MEREDEVNFISMIHLFFTEVKTYVEGTDFLKKYMKRKIKDYSISMSRKIFYSLIVYKFGKELDYPEPLQTKARQLILFTLQNNQDTIQRKKIFKDFIDELERYKEEDFKNYMYELGVQYNQLTEMYERLSEHEEWMESIRDLQNKILDQVVSLKGVKIFQECLETLSMLKKEIVKEHLLNAYWDIMLEDLSIKKYDGMMKNYISIRDILLEMHDDQDTKDMLDEKYIRQLLDNDLFTQDTLITQVDFIYQKLKIYGVPIYDSLIEKTKNNLVKKIRENGLCSESVVEVFKETLPILDSYIQMIRIYRKAIQEHKTQK
jgi:hypothetical protein